MTSYTQTQLHCSCWYTCAANVSRNSMSLKAGSLMATDAMRITAWSDKRAWVRRLSSHTSTLPWNQNQNMLFIERKCVVLDVHGKRLEGKALTNISMFSSNPPTPKNMGGKHMIMHVMYFTWATTGFSSRICSFSRELMARILSYSFSSKVTVFTLSNTPRRWAWMVCESLAWPRISRRAGSDTKKKRGNNRRFFSR